MVGQSQTAMNKGNPNCKHQHVNYIDNGFDGQAWWCDETDCERHEKMNYSAGEKIIFPSNALIRTPNPEFGGGSFYAHKADSDGIVRNRLQKQEWIPYENIESKI